MTRKEILKNKGLVRYTSKTVTDPKRFLGEVEQVKEQGYAVDDEEYIPGVRAVAAPLLSSSSQPAALWLVGFTSTLNDHKIKTAIRDILETVQEINQSLGGTLKKKLFA